MTQQLTVHNVEIHTASVEIKTLTIKGRQVTLSVFRQIFQAMFFERDTAEFRGLPRGFVNYHSKDCWGCGYLVEWRHISLIWQDGKSLYRAPVGPPMAWGRRLPQMRDANGSKVTGFGPLDTIDGRDVRPGNPEEIYSRHQTGYQRLRQLQLPQLFIAV